MTQRISRRHALAALALPLLEAAPVHANTDWPTNTLKLMVPFSAGSAPDVFARLYADQLRTSLGHPVIVDNKPGANQTIGTQAVISAPANGYTVLLTSTEVVRAPLLYPNAKYDPLHDLIPLAQLCQVSVTLYVPARLGVSTLREFVDLAKKSPKPVTFAAPGQWSASHFYALLFARQAGIPLNFVPYKAETEMVPDLLSGQLDAGFFASPQMAQLEQQGRVKMLASAGMAQRPVAYPNLPTFRESGYNGLDVPGFLGFFVTRGTPAAIVERLRSELTKAAARSEIQSQISAFGFEAPAREGERASFKNVVALAHGSWKEIIQQLNLKAE